MARGQKLIFCVRNPRNINVFVRVPGWEESGSRPGGSVTGVTEKLFMCQMFMCLFRPLTSGGGFYAHKGRVTGFSRLADFSSSKLWCTQPSHPTAPLRLSSSQLRPQRSLAFAPRDVHAVGKKAHRLVSSDPAERRWRTTFPQSGKTLSPNHHLRPKLTSTGRVHHVM